MFFFLGKWDRCVDNGCEEFIMVMVWLLLKLLVMIWFDGGVEK